MNIDIVVNNKTIKAADIAHLAGLFYSKSDNDASFYGTNGLSPLNLLIGSIYGDVSDFFYGRYCDFFKFKEQTVDHRDAFDENDTIKIKSNWFGALVMIWQHDGYAQDQTSMKEQFEEAQNLILLAEKSKNHVDIKPDWTRS